MILRRKGYLSMASAMIIHRPHRIEKVNGEEYIIASEKCQRIHPSEICPISEKKCPLIGKKLPITIDKKNPICNMIRFIDLFSDEKKFYEVLTACSKFDLSVTDEKFKEATLEFCDKYGLISKEYLEPYGHDVLSLRTFKIQMETVKEIINLLEEINNFYDANNLQRNRDNYHFSTRDRLASILNTILCKVTFQIKNVPKEDPLGMSKNEKKNRYNKKEEISEEYVFITEYQCEYLFENIGIFIYDKLMSNGGIKACEYCGDYFPWKSIHQYCSNSCKKTMEKRRQRKREVLYKKIFEKKLSLEECAKELNWMPKEVKEKYKKWLDKENKKRRA